VGGRPEPCSPIFFSSQVGPLLHPSSRTCFPPRRMSRTYPSQALLPVALLFLLATATAQLVNPGTRPATITKDSNWMTLKKCVNQCIWDQGSNDTPDIGGDLADHLSCGSPYVNGCYCNPQSATLAHSFITMCANYLCNSYYKSPPAQTDIESGTAVYASYCTSAMGAAYTPESISQAPLPNTGAPGTYFAVGNLW